MFIHSERKYLNDFCRKDTNKRAKTYQACLNIFLSERKYLNDFCRKDTKVSKRFILKIRISERYKQAVGANRLIRPYLISFDIVD